MAFCTEPEFISLNHRLCAKYFVLIAVLFSGGLCPGVTHTAQAAAPAPADEATKLIAQAAEEVGYLGFDTGYSLFKQAVQVSKPGSKLWLEAMLGQAICAQQITPPTRSKIAEAESLFKQILEQDSKSFIAARAVLNLGRLAELSDYYGDEEDLPGARKYYQQAIDTWPDDPIAGEATLRLAATYIQTYVEADVLKGVAILQDWLAKHPNELLASAMWQYLGDTYFTPLKDYRKAVDSYIKADDLGLTEKGREGQLYWRMAILADRYLKDRDVAVKYYTKIINVTPTSGKAYESQLALKRLGAPVPELRELLSGSKETDTKSTPNVTKKEPAPKGARP